MFVYEKKLQYPVRIKNPNPALAKFIISQYGGPDGELGASLRYLSQRYTMGLRTPPPLITVTNVSGITPGFAKDKRHIRSCPGAETLCAGALQFICALCTECCTRNLRCASWCIHQTRCG